MSTCVLVVDDDPIMQELAGANLRETGYDVMIANDGREALTAIHKRRPDLIISDLDMPEMDGFEMTRAIRSDVLTNDIPIIVVTASDHADAVEEAFAVGATSFLAKPINWTLFGQAVKFVLRASDDQKNLRIARDKAEAGVLFKDALMSLMSHELRTPLNAIIGFGQLIGDQFSLRGDDVHKEYSDYIVEGGKRLLNTISDMLLASDARSGPLTLNEIDTTVGEIAEMAQSFAANSSKWTEAKFSLRMQDPNQELCCDRTLVARALAKLIDNSLVHSEPGVEITLGTAVTKQGALAFLVKDNGPGLRDDDLAQINTPFSRSDMALKSEDAGLRLGWPMVKAIAAAHNCNIQARSTAGVGTQIVFLVSKERVSSGISAQKGAA